MTSTDAFLLLQIFRRRALPTLLRRLQTWKGFDRAMHADLVDDLNQELWLDCLQNADDIVALPTRDRHVRWFRLVERNHYRLHIRADRRRASDAVLDALPDRIEGSACEADAPDHTWHSDASHPDAERANPPGLDPVGRWGGDLPTPHRKFLRRLAASASYMKNGRINCRESARSLGMRARDIKARWGDVAEDLGFDSEYLQFWRRRLVEALLGLAADLLRDAGKVTVHGEHQRRKPDPTGRLRRIRQLRRRLGCRPIPRDVKHVLAHYHRRSSPAGLDPIRILRHAERLLPDDPAVQLWRFEAHLAGGDATGAMHAIRAARAHGAERVPVSLARARLLEFRGKEAAARRLLSTRREAELRDERLRSALRRLAG